MPDHDVIIIGAGHNGLTAASLLARAGVDVLCLEKNRYVGGMASTVELFDGYHFEIAGSVIFPIAPYVVAGPLPVLGPLATRVFAALGPRQEAASSTMHRRRNVRQAGREASCNCSPPSRRPASAGRPQDSKTNAVRDILAERSS
jgi:monoamine oxidase